MTGEEKISYSQVSLPSELDGFITVSAEFEGHMFSHTEADLESFRQKLSDPHAFQLLAIKDHNKPVAYLGASESLFPGHLFIFELLVDSSAQGLGIGRSMVKQAIEFARKEELKGVYVETESWNTPGQKLYENCGFKQVNNPDWKEGVTLLIAFCL